MIQSALTAGYGPGFSVWSPASADGQVLAHPKKHNKDKPSNSKKE